MSQNTEGGGEVTADGLAALRAEIVAVRRARQDTQRAAAGRHTVERALEAAERDRDAVSSPQLETLRRRGEDATARLLAGWGQIDSLRILVAQVRSAGFDVGEDPAYRGGAELMRLFAEEEQWRAGMQARLDEAGVVGVRVPSPVPLPELPTTGGTASRRADMERDGGARGSR